MTTLPGELQKRPFREKRCDAEHYKRPEQNSDERTDVVVVSSSAETNDQGDGDSKAGARSQEAEPAKIVTPIQVAHQFSNYDQPGHDPGADKHLPWRLLNETRRSRPGRPLRRIRRFGPRDALRWRLCMIVHRWICGVRRRGEVSRRAFSIFAVVTQCIVHKAACGKYKARNGDEGGHLVSFQHAHTLVTVSHTDFGRNVPRPAAAAPPVHLGGVPAHRPVRAG